MDPPKILYEDFIPVFFSTSLLPFPSFLPTSPWACPFSLLHCHDVSHRRHRGGHLTRPSVSRGKPGTVGNVPCHYTKGADILNPAPLLLLPGERIDLWMLVSSLPIEHPSCTSNAPVRPLTSPRRSWKMRPCTRRSTNACRKDISSCSKPRTSR